MRQDVGKREKQSEGFLDPLTDIHANAGFSQETETRIHRARERRRITEPETEILRQKRV